MQFDERASLKDLSLLSGLAGDFILTRIHPPGQRHCGVIRETHIRQLRMSEAKSRMVEQSLP